MKILIICPDDLSTLIFSKTLSKLLKTEYGSEIFTMSPVGMYKNELAELNSTHLQVAMTRWLSPYKDLVYMISLYTIIKESKFDQVITFTTKPNIYGVIAAKLAGTPNITLAVRGLGQIFNENNGVRSRLLRFVLTHLYTLACFCANHVWFTNRMDEIYFLDKKMVQSKKCFLTRNAIDLSEFSKNSVSHQKLRDLKAELNLSGDDKVIIMVARLIWSKGISEYCEAAVRMYKKYPHLKFILVAPVESGSAESVPVDYIVNIEVNSNLKWLGFRKDVKNLYALADLSVLPSYYKEGGYPRALLEAMAFSKPVIAADTLDCRGPIDVGKNGYLVTPKNVDSLVKAIETVFADETRRRRLGVHSLKKVKREFDDQLVVREVLKKIMTTVKGEGFGN